MENKVLKIQSILKTLTQKILPWVEYLLQLPVFFLIHPYTQAYLHNMLIQNSKKYHFI